MSKAKTAFESIRKINESYGLSNDRIDQYEKGMKTARVCAPVVGKFSAGKSAMINTLLGGHYLRQDITPETALPAEIVYSDGENHFRLKSHSGDWRDLTPDEWKKGKWTVSTADCLRLTLNNKELAEIPDLMIVDMPGFESGIAAHDKAIDQYIAKSMVYILAFPADDMILRRPMERFLAEIQLYHKPVQIAITKWDKRNPEEWKDALEALKNKIASLLQVSPEAIPVCHTSQVDQDAEGLKEMLRNLQGQAKNLLEKKYDSFALEEAAHTESYLKSFLAGSALTVSELDEKEEELQQKIKEVQETFEKNKADFTNSMTGIADIVTADVQAALNGQTSSFVAMASSGKDIGESVNQTVRMAVTKSIQGKLVPSILKYLDQSQRLMPLPNYTEGLNLQFQFNTSEVESSVTPVIVKAVTGVVKKIFMGPIGTLLAAAIEKLAEFFCGGHDEENQEAKIRRQLQTEIYGQILEKVRVQVGESASKQIAAVNEKLAAEMARQQDTLMKALSDVRQKMAEEAKKKEADEAAAKKALDTIHAIQAGLA